MNLFPAIDLMEGQAIRLLRGDYAQKTVYSENPVSVALDMKACGARFLHLVDLEGAKTGETPNFDVVCRIKNESGMFCEIGGGIRTMEVMDRYLSAGLDRVILGTAAVTEEGFVERAVQKYGERIAVGIDACDGWVAVKGWTEKTQLRLMDFCAQMEQVGVKTIICTDISKDGAMGGTNRALYEELSRRFSLQITASGGVSSLEDVRALREMNLYGAIIGKAYYTGALSLKEALEVAK